MKRALLASIGAQLQAELEQLRAATKAAHAAATDEESKPENQYDTRALEASYLAEAQGKRVAELERILAVLEEFPVRLCEKASSGALLELESEGKSAWYFLLPFGAGLSASGEGRQVTVVTLDSPLGRLLQGKAAGDLVELRRGDGSVKEYEILKIE